MARRTGDFEHESIEDPQSIAAYLEALAKGFRNGKLSFCSGNKELILKPQLLVKFGVRASNKDEAAKLAIRIVWKNRRRKLADSPPLIIESPSEDETGDKQEG